MVQKERLIGGTDAAAPATPTACLLTSWSHQILTEGSSLRTQIGMLEIDVAKAKLWVSAKVNRDHLGPSRMWFKMLVAEKKSGLVVRWPRATVHYSGGFRGMINQPKGVCEAVRITPANR